jgi:SH3-like domain-containing protein
VAPPAPTQGGAVLELVAAEVEPDSVTWQPAVARTWVNVRNDASPNGEVVGVISPDSRAMLGTTRRGWRRVALDDVSGWVDPRLFSSANTGG